jgi:hypothetical protein
MQDAMFGGGVSNEALGAASLKAARGVVENLVGRYSIVWAEVPGLHVSLASGSYDATPADIQTPPVSTELTYFAAVHGIGHVVLKLPSFTQPDGNGNRDRLY